MYKGQIKNVVTEKAAERQSNEKTAARKKGTNIDMYEQLYLIHGSTTDSEKVILVKRWRGFLKSATCCFIGHLVPESK